MNIDFEFSHDHHLQCGFEKDASLCFVARPGRCKTQPRTPVEEAIRAAQLIYEKSDRDPIWLCMSGGVDSEAMAYAFRMAKIPFQVAIMRFENELNAFDIWQAEKFCRQHSISHQFFDVDIIDFFESEKYKEVALKYNCASPQLTAHLHLLEKIEGLPVLTWNPPAIQIHPSHYVIQGPSSRYFCYETVFRKHSRKGVGLVFLYTPELIYSFLRLPFVQRALLKPSDHIAEFSNRYEVKIRCYIDGGFQVQPRLKNRTGFEEVKNYFHKKMNDYDNPVFDQMFRQPLIDILPNEEKTKFLLSRADLFESESNYFAGAQRQQPPEAIAEILGSTTTFELSNVNTRS